jgi:hypothetical protein
MIIQDNKPLGFFSKKLTETQCRYPITDQELLAIVETFKYFKHMLLGHEIVVKTDHKNLTHPASTHISDHILHQQRFLEGYSINIQYIKGKKNIVAAALSRITIEELFLFDVDGEFPLNLQ